MDKAERQALEARLQHVQHGFKEMQLAAQEIVTAQSTDAAAAWAAELYTSELYQVRMTAVFVYGYIALQRPAVLDILRKKVSQDPSWQVQEILAQAFNQYCKDSGYEKSVPIITDWLSDAEPNVKRAVSEGLRIWDQRPYFKEHPEQAVKLLSKWKAHDSEYLRKSIGNALRDISRKEPELIRREVATWDRQDPNIAFTYELASKFL